MFYFKAVTRIILAILLIASPSMALAQFQASKAKVFIDWPELQVDPMPGQQSEAMVYAVIDGDVALYTIAVQNRNSISALGAFQCNKEFTVLKTSSNEFRDIRCVNRDVFGKLHRYVLKFNGGLYEQIF